MNILRQEFLIFLVSVEHTTSIKKHFDTPELDL